MNLKQFPSENSLIGLVSVPEELLWRANLRSKHSQRTYDQSVKQFLSFLNIKTPEELRLVIHSHVIAFRNSLEEQGKASATINNRISALSSLFDHLIDQQIVKINPTRGVKRMVTEYGTVKSKCLSIEEARKILDAPNTNTIMHIRDRAILATLLYTGCRRSEVCTLRVKDFFEEKGYPILDFKLKGGKRNRVAIHPLLKSAIESYLNVMGHIEDKESPLFRPVQGNQHRSFLDGALESKSIERLWKKYAKVAGFEGTSPHSARTTFISTALENNVSMEATQQTVGHSQIKTTQMYDKRNKKYQDSASFSVRY